MTGDMAAEKKKKITREIMTSRFGKLLFAACCPDTCGAAGYTFIEDNYPLVG